MYMYTCNLRSYILFLFQVWFFSFSYHVPDGIQEKDGALQYSFISGTAASASVVYCDVCPLQCVEGCNRRFEHTMWPWYNTSAVMTSCSTIGGYLRF